ncbi:Rhs element Vgr protein, partial [Salinisphaera sp. C84B14]|uniref:DUF2345 domain-containing protein n=1 Tax=Salinisphaera sp. C84B14 TaxID=1304155 RepID=UPI00333E7493
TQGGTGDVPAWARPDLIASAPAGIAALTPKDHIVSAGKTLSATAGDINIATQNDHVAAVALGLRLYTQGQAADGNKPNQETGIALHAATGPVTAQAQSAKAKLAADQSVTIASTQADVNVSAMKHILLTAAGSGLEIKGANITLTAPGAVKFHAGQHVLTGPGSASPAGLNLPQSDLYDERFILKDKKTGRPLPMEPYRVVDNQGRILAQGWTDHEGRSARVWTGQPKPVRLLHGFGTDEAPT